MEISIKQRCPYWKGVLKETVVCGASGFEASKLNCMLTKWREFPLGQQMNLPLREISRYFPSSCKIRIITES